MHALGRFAFKIAELETDRNMTGGETPALVCDTLGPALGAMNDPEPT